jgi:hypothetical protein
MLPARRLVSGLMATETTARTTAQATAARTLVPTRWLDPPVPATLIWLPLVLVADRGADIWVQRGLGLLTWLLLLALLRRETPLVRAQVAVVVAFATAVEYTFSPLLHVYVYRLGNVPAFVPPGHGLVYLCALAIGRSIWVRRREQALVTLTVLAGGTYAAWGVLVSARPDLLGAFWYLCLVGFLAFGGLAGRSRTLYVGAFVVVTYLELLGTRLGTWAWATHDPSGLVSIGNPPSGAAGGYGWFDLAAVLAGPAVLGVVVRLRSGPVRSVLAEARRSRTRPNPPINV